jgi:hypothetical protein
MIMPPFQWLLLNTWLISPTENSRDQRRAFVGNEVYQRSEDIRFGSVLVLTYLPKQMFFMHVDYFSIFGSIQMRKRLFQNATKLQELFGCRSIPPDKLSPEFGPVV